jgi:hypothetical protein
MKIDAFLARHPEAETLAALKSLGPGAPPPAPDVARLISQQRDSQMQTLARAMVGPRFEGDFAEAATGRERPRREPRHRELRHPRKASSLFLATCAQAGAVLRSLDLSNVDDADRALGSLLVLVSLAREAPREREEHRGRWREVAAETERLRTTVRLGRTPFGAVLTPMLLEALSQGEVMVDWMVGELSGGLDDEIGRRDLERWTRRTIREGAARLEELSAGALERVEEEEAPAESETEGGYRPAREPLEPLELSLAGGRTAVDRFLDVVGNLPEVMRIERDSGWEGGLTTVTIWSYVPLPRERLARLAQEAGVVIIERGGGTTLPG